MAKDMIERKLSDGYTCYVIDSAYDINGQEYWLWQDSISGDEVEATVTKADSTQVIGYTFDDLDTWLVERDLLSCF